MAEASEAVWYVRPPEGGQFGPAGASMMRTWIAEGRVGPNSLVWREGWRDWQEASGVFGQLGGTGTGPAMIQTAGSGSGRTAPDAYHPRANRRLSPMSVAFIFMLFLAVIVLAVVFIWVLKG